MLTGRWSRAGSFSTARWLQGAAGHRLGPGSCPGGRLVLDHRPRPAARGLPGARVVVSTNLRAWGWACFPGAGWASA